MHTLLFPITLQLHVMFFFCSSINVAKRPGSVSEDLINIQPWIYFYFQDKVNAHFSCDVMTEIHFQEFVV